jgi:hypothetical protein
MYATSNTVNCCRGERREKEAKRQQGNKKDLFEYEQRLAGMTDQNNLRFWFGNCVMPDDGSLIRAETCCLH